jgi:UDP-N-acetyl-D-mannosaminuronic acid dehydrogenase
MKHPFKKISVLGLGYIGLPTAAVLASRGIDVLGVDVNQRVVDTINGAGIHIVEPDLDVVVRAAVTMKKLRAATRPDQADAYLIAVPTPFKDDKEPDLAYVEAATRSIAPVLRKGNLVILESTSPVGTTDRVAAWLAELRPDLSFPQHAGEAADVQLAYCPERVLPGHVLKELVNNDRIIGGMTAHCARRAADLYRIFVEGECVLTEARSAEMCKLTENAFRDVNIAFANELSLICDRLDINVWELIQLANRHPRVSILNPGPGVGGHCIAVDPWFIVNSAPEQSVLIRAARGINDGKPGYVLSQVQQQLADLRQHKRPVVACLGLAFKANIDDLRESPALDIVVELARDDGLDLHVVEPYVEALPPALAGKSNVRLVELHEALQAADVVIGLVDHNAFKQMDVTLLANKRVIDTRGIWR